MEVNERKDQQTEILEPVEQTDITPSDPETREPAPKKKLPVFAILAIITVVAALVLGITNLVTNGPIAASQKAEKEAAFKAVIPPDLVPEGGSVRFTAVTDDLQRVENSATGELLGYAVRTSAQGYGGSVGVVLGFDRDGNVVGAQIGDGSFQETAGLGAKWVYGSNVSKLLGISASDGGKFDAISGATVTSRAVLSAVNEGTRAVAEQMGKDWGENDPVSFGSAKGGTYIVTASGGTYAAVVSGVPTEEQYIGRAQGFGGTVTVLMTMDYQTEDEVAEGEDPAYVIRSIDIQVPDETHGYGSRWANQLHWKQFIGKSLPIAQEDFDAVSGATVTSGAVLSAVNNAVPNRLVQQEAAGDTALYSNPDGMWVIGFDGRFTGTVNTALEVEKGAVVSHSLTAEAVAEAVADNTLTGTAAGYGDQPVTVYITLDEAGAIATIEVDASTQTVGLGSRTSDESFTQQFIGKTRPIKESDIEIIGGASVSSRAVIAAVNGATVWQPGATLRGTAAGYGDGEVIVTMTLDDEGKIATIEVDASTQTAGIGQRCAEEGFTGQFIGKAAPLTIDEDIDALSGATVTSRAVVEAVNGAAKVKAEEAEQNASGEPVSVVITDEKTAAFTFDDRFTGEVTVTYRVENGKLIAAEVDDGTDPAPGFDAGKRYEGTAAAFRGEPVTVYVTFDENGAIAILEVDASTQTQGIGQKCAEEAFTSRFIGKSVPLTLGEDVDAITGATETSAAVVDAVNSAAAGAAGTASAVEAGKRCEGTAAAFRGEPVTVYVTFDENGAIAALEVDASTQTPGIGQKCAEETFTSRFIGKTAPLTPGKDIDAITGATETCSAVVEAVNSAAAGSGTVAAEPEGSVYTAEKPGYNSQPVTVYVTLDESGAIATLKVDASTQTPGIGQNCESEGFTSQFIGKSGKVMLGNGIDAVSGATETSTAVVRGVNEILKNAAAESAAAAQAPAAEETPLVTVDEQGRYVTSYPGFPADENNAPAGEPITIYVTLDENGAIATLEVDASTQTPEIGQKCAEEAFTSQFIGKSGKVMLGNGIDAVGGATVTSTAVVRAVNQLFKNLPAETTQDPAAEETPLVTVDEQGRYVTSYPGFPADENNAPAGEPITIYVTLDENGAIATLEVDASTQTPEIGQKCAEEAFTSQFIGKSGKVMLGNGIDAVGGATVTSTAVVRAVNQLFKNIP